MIEVREEAADGPAARALWTEYQELVRDRLGDRFVPTEEIFASDSAFAQPGAAWLVVYDGRRAVACGGLRPLDDEVAEIKRMFVSADARGRGHGRRLLAELERRAAAAGFRRVRLLTTEVLVEARELYRRAGYEVVDAPRPGGRQDYWLERAL